MGSSACDFSRCNTRSQPVIVYTVPPPPSATLTDVIMSVLMTAGKNAAKAKAAEKESKKKKKAAAAKSAAANRFGRSYLFDFCRAIYDGQFCRPTSPASPTFHLDRDYDHPRLIN